MIPNILSIAGSDPSGGAGIQADIKAISANGAYAMAAITALTAQNTQRVTGVEAVSPEFVLAQIAAIRADVHVDAVKIGMLGTAPIIRAVVEALDGLAVPVVLDPVMVAKGGDRLLQADAVAALRAAVSMSSVLTPNLPEAADLLETEEARTLSQMEAQARALLALGAKAVLLKGGHLPGQQCPDLLADGGGLTWLHGTRHATRKTHGTGCTLSSALAAQLGHGMPLAEAARKAKAYVTRAIATADDLTVGRGHGPTHHFHAFFERTDT
ncbi:MAG: bifunctional hydroxymethylpyrimidine kinase/phosphomethylpyrimidine kinase [Jannaschia sp.]